MLNINPFVIVLLAAVVVAFLVLFFRRNRRDRKEMEDSINATEMDADNHPDEGKI